MSGESKLAFLKLLSRILLVDSSLHSPNNLLFYFSYTLPIRVFGVACRLPCNGVFEYLSAIDLLLYCTTCNEPIYDHVLVLTDTKHPVYSLGVCGRVPTGIIYVCRNERKDLYHVILETSDGGKPASSVICLHWIENFKP